MSRSYPAGGLALLLVLAAGGQAAAQVRDTVPTAESQPTAMPAETGTTHVRFVNAVPTLAAATLSLGGQNLFSNVAYRSATPYMTVTSVTGALSVQASTEAGVTPPVNPHPPIESMPPSNPTPAPAPLPSDSVPAPAPLPSDSVPAPTPLPSDSVPAPTPAPAPTDTIGRVPAQPAEPMGAQAEAPSAVAGRQEIEIDGKLEEGGYYTIVAVADEDGSQRLRVFKDEVAQPSGDVAARADESGKAKVRVIYAIQGDKVDIGFQGEESLWDDVNASTGPEYKEIDPSKTTLLVTPDAGGEGSQVGNLSFQAGQNYTVVLTGSDAKVDVVQLQDGVSTTEAPATPSTPAVTDSVATPGDTTTSDPTPDPSKEPTDPAPTDPAPTPSTPKPY